MIRFGSVHPIEIPLVRWQLRTLAGHSGKVTSAAVSRDGNRIVSGSSDTLVKIWNAKTGEEVGSVVGEW